MLSLLAMRSGPKTGRCSHPSSVVATCRLNDVNPVAYLAETLEAIINGDPQSQIEELMPWRFRKTSSPNPPTSTQSARATRTSWRSPSWTWRRATSESPKGQHSPSERQRRARRWPCSRQSAFASAALRDRECRGASALPARRCREPH